MADRKETECVVCNLCGSRFSRPYLRKFDEPIVKCLRCGLVYTNPRLTEKELFQRYGREYLIKEYLPAFGATLQDFSLEVALHRFSLYFEILEKSGLPGRKILDVGAGAGFFVKAARHLEWEAEGIEVSESAAAYGRDILGVSVRTGKFEDLRDPPSSFDAVLLSDTIEHLRDPLGDLRKIHGLLKPEGILLVQTPDLRSLSRLFFGRQWAVFSPEEHLFYFSRKTLAAMLRKAGFRTIGLRNLLQFNAEHTHDKSTLGYRLWKSRQAKWAGSPLRLKIDLYERKEILRTVERDAAARRPESTADRASVSRWIRFKWRLHAAAKRMLHGDQLLAVAAPGRPGAAGRRAEPGRN